MTKPKRYYSNKTLKILFALSGNQCAYPSCMNPVILPSTQESESAVLSQISHIYAINEDGPRGKTGLTEKELNAPENLVLFCPTHHIQIDKQHETYPAKILKEWKKTHESKTQKQISVDFEYDQQKRFYHSCFPTELVDKKIESEVNILRKSRFFLKYDKVSSSLALAKSLTEGELSGGTIRVKSRALAWCVRCLSIKNLDKAEKYLNIALSLGTCSEIDISNAFIVSKKGDKNAALSILAKIDTPISRSAAIMIVASHESPKATLQWLKKTGINVADLDSDGKYFLLTRQLGLGHWELAQETIEKLTKTDLIETPILNHWIGITHLTKAITDELRTVVLNQLPFEAANFPLSSDSAGVDARRLAHRYFVKANQIALQLNCPYMATIDDEYALWLELRDTIEHNKGKHRLEEKLRNPDTALRLVHLGLQFGITLDLAAIESEIEKQIALHGQITFDAAIARFALAKTKKSPEEVASYISRHFDELVNVLDRKTLRFLQIEMFAKSGLSKKANECMNILRKEGLSETENNRLQRIIAEAKGANAIEARKEQFKKSNSIDDLKILIDALESSNKWDEICEFGKILFERTCSLQDAEQLVNALNNSQNYNRLIEFIESNREMFAQSQSSQLLYCWSLYHEGKLLEAYSEFKKLGKNRDSPSFRSLEINLGISLGNWSSLSSFVANELLEKNERSAQDLIRAAQLALHLSSPHAKELTFAAADKGENDASILAAAYFLASNAGWEENIEVSKWLYSAAALSGDGGPIQEFTLKDILNQKPEWDRRESKTWRLLNTGDVPMFHAANSLNKSLINLMLFPAIINLSEKDPRRRSVVPAYSGARKPMQIDADITVGIDATSLLTLSFLNLIDKALDAFNTVYVPHSTLSWLFEEKQKAVFHQPSLIRKARKFGDLFATEILEKFVPTTVADSDLSDQVGSELASLIADAEKMRDDDNTQRIVVCSSPVYRLGSLMEEEANLTPYATVLSSCQCIVDKLREKGQITIEEEEKARAYLQLHEKPWPHQTEITDGAILYLDDSPMTYFLHLEIIEKIQASGFRLIASPKKVSETNELISYENISQKVNDSIEQIRSAINTRIKSGKIKIGRQYNTNELKEQSISGHPTVSLFGLAKECDAIIADDRFLNFDGGDVQVPIFSTLDLLDMLVSTGAITHENLLEKRTLLRRAGYCFIPLNSDELSIHLNTSSVEDNNVVERAELKAIRENMLQIRMGNWLRLPKEALWIDVMFRIFIQTLKSQWKVDADLSNARIWSNWILDQIDIRGWAHCQEFEIRDNIVKAGRGANILVVVISTDDVPRDVKDEYFKWVEVDFLAAFKEQYPNQYSWIVDWLKGHIAETVKRNLEAEKIDEANSPYFKSALAHATLKFSPPMVRRSLLDDSVFLEEYGLSVKANITYENNDVTFQRCDLFNAVRKILSGASLKNVTDKNQHRWKLKNCSEGGELPNLILSRGEQCLSLPNLEILSLDRNVRLRSFEIIADDVNLSTSERKKWYNILKGRALDDNEVNVYRDEFRDTPITNARNLQNEIENRQKNDVSTLVPHSRRYYDRLVGAYDGSTSIQEYATHTGKKHFDQLSKWKSYEGFLNCLLVTSHSSLTTEIYIDQLDNQKLTNAFDFIDKYGDRISQLGAIEVGLRILPSTIEIEPFLIRLIKKLRDDDVEGPASSFKLLSALFLLVDGELSNTRLFSNEPPFYRRLAALSQAAQIQRQLANANVDIDKYYDWSFKFRGAQFYLQSFTDMRLEPRWYPDLAVPSQIKADFLGRIMIAAKKYESNIKDGELFDLTITDKAGSLRAKTDLFYPYLPGPLEGVEKSQNELPLELKESIENQLDTNELKQSSFNTLLNSALLFNVDLDQAELAAKSLKLVNHRLTNIENKSELLSILIGLALVAAVSRSCLLADELQILVRKYRFDAKYKLSIDEVIRISLMSSASHTNLNDWREFSGKWLSELAFSNLEGTDGEILHWQLQYLCHLVPELWVTGGRADAALSALKSI